MTKPAGLEQYLETATDSVRALVSALDAADPDPPEVKRLVSEVRALERQCVAALSVLSAKAKAHSVAGEGLPVEVVLRAGSAVSDAAARQHSDRARVARRFAAVGSAITSGEAFSENIDVLARITARMSPDEITEMAEVHDDRLADASVRLSSDSFRKVVQRCRDRIRQDHGQTAAEQATAETCASVSPRRDNNTYRLHAIFDTLQGTAAHNALSNEWHRLTDDLGAGHGLTADQISAQALHDLIVRGAATTPDADNNRPGVTIHVITDGHTLARGPHANTISETQDGLRICPTKIGQLSCDCVIQRIESLPDGHVNSSYSSRTATPTQRAALRALYDSCPISGAPWSQIEVHHVHFVTDGGKTELSNLIPISRIWHHRIHDDGWTLEMAADRTLTLSCPDGTHHETIPPPTPVLYKQDNHALAA